MAIKNLRTSINDMVENRLASLNTGCPGIIQSYDRTTRLATVQPAVKVQYEGEDGETVEESLPLLVNVPVHFPGSGRWGLVWDLSPPESCWIKFSQSSIDQWLEDGKLAPSTAARRFSLSDAVAEVGLRDKAHMGIECPANTMRLGADDGPQILFDLKDLKVSIRALNEIEIAAGVRIVLDAAEVYINGQLYEVPA